MCDYTDGYWFGYTGGTGRPMPDFVNGEWVMGYWDGRGDCETHKEEGVWFVSPKTGTISAIYQDGWLPCNGAAVPTSEYPELNALLGMYNRPHPDGRHGTTFHLPDLRGRVIYG